MIDVSLLSGAFPPPISAVAPIALENPVDRASKQRDEVGRQGAFGPAYVLSLSPQAQAMLNGSTTGQPVSENTVLENYQLSARPPRGPGEQPPLGAERPDGPPPPGGGRPGTAMEKDTEIYESVEDTQERSKRKVRPLVGSVGADQVVDENGNVDRVKLRELMQRFEELANRFKPDHVTYAAISLVS